MKAIYKGAALAAAAGVVFCTALVLQGSEGSTVEDYVANCDGYEDMLLPWLRWDEARIRDYTAYFDYEDGAPISQGSYGPHHSPWIVSLVGLYNLDLYCRTGDDKAFDVAASTRRWLVDNAVDKGSFARYEYSFPNPPYAEEPGWGSAFDQSGAALLLLRVHPRFSLTDQAKVRKIVTAFTVPIDRGGLYSNYIGDTIFWEEVAVEGRPSTIINGAIITAYNIDQMLSVMWPLDTTAFDLQNPEGTLADLNFRAMRGILAAMPDVLAGDGSGTTLRYDLTTDPINLRTRVDYPYFITLDGMRWLRDQGFDVEDYIETLEAMR